MKWSAPLHMIPIWDLTFSSTVTPSSNGMEWQCQILEGATQLWNLATLQGSHNTEKAPPANVY